MKRDYDSDQEFQPLSLLETIGQRVKLKNQANTSSPTKISVKKSAQGKRTKILTPKKKIHQDYQ